MNKNIVLMQFSSRENGNCSAICKHIQNRYTAENVSTFIMDANTVQACSNCNYECLTPGKNCPNLSHQQSAAMDAICNADVVYYLIPNYCGYPCANYFVYNEKSVGYFNGDRALMQKYMEVPKRFIIISNTEGANFENAIRQQTKGELDILYMKTSKYGKRSTAGDIMESDAAQADLDAFLDSFTFA